MSVDIAPIACRELVELVTDYLEGALSPEQHARFENHIAGCDGCTTYLEQMRETIRLTGTLREHQYLARRTSRAAARLPRLGVGLSSAPAAQRVSAPTSRQTCRVKSSP